MDKAKKSDSSQPNILKRETLIHIPQDETESNGESGIC